MKIICMENEKHVQVNDLAAENASLFWQEMCQKYAGHEINFCFHNTDVPEAFMQTIGAFKLESCREARLTSENFKPVDGCLPVVITKESFAGFSRLHEKRNPQMYWSSARIGADLSKWCIHRQDDSYCLMSLWGDTPEIFALETITPHEGAMLLSAAACFAFDAGKKGILFMLDDGAEIAFEAARSTGFVICGKYTAYRGRIPV
jgi:hypothetical protein